MKIPLPNEKDSSKGYKAIAILSLLTLLAACIFAQAHAASCYTVSGKTICSGERTVVTCTKVGETTTCTED